MQRENGSGRRKRSQEFRKRGFEDEEEDGRTRPLPCSARTRMPRLHVRAGPRGPSGVSAPPGADFRASRNSAEAASPPREDEPRAATKPQYLRNVAMISPSSL